MNVIVGRIEEGGVRLDQPSGWPVGQRVLVIALPTDELTDAGAPPAALLEEDARGFAPRRDALRNVNRSERRLQRPLTEAERAALAQRVGKLSVDRLLDVPVELSAEALAEWLADPAAS